MAQLTNQQQKEKAAIAFEALRLIPTRHTAAVYPMLCDLCELALFDDSYLEKIQHLVNLAQSDNLAQIDILMRSLSHLD